MGLCRGGSGADAMTSHAEADQRGQFERDGEDHGAPHGLGVLVATFMLLLDISGCP